MRKTARFLKFLLTSCIVAAIVLYAGLYLLLSVPAVQERVRAVGVAELKRLLGTEVSIRRVDIQPFHKIALHDVCLSDRTGDTLLYANKLAAGFDLLPLLQQKLVFTTIQLFGFQVNLQKETPDAPLNTEFITKLLRSDTPSDGRLDLKIRMVVIRKGSVRYDVLSEPRAAAGRFDPHHIRVRNLLSTMTLKAFDADTLQASVKRLSFEERSGFVLNRLAFQVSANRDAGSIRDFELLLPHSELRLDSASVAYAGIDSMTQFYNEARIFLQTGRCELHPSDLSAFVPGLKNVTLPLRIACRLEGEPNRLELKQLHIRHADQIALLAEGSLSGLSAPEETFVFGKIRNLALSETGLKELLSAVSAPDGADLAHRIGGLRFQGEVSGFFNDLVTFGTLSSPHGSIRADILLSHDYRDRSLAFKGNVSTRDFDLSSWNREKQNFGKISLRLQVDGRKPYGEPASGKLAGDIEAFDWNGYNYQNIRMNGSVDRTAYTGVLSADDPNGKLELEGTLDLLDRKPVFRFTAKAEKLRLHELRLIDRYPGSELSFRMDANFTGNSPDNAEGSLSLSRAQFVNAGHRFVLDSLTIEADKQSNPESLRIRSALLNGNLSGRYAFSSLGKALMRMLDRSIPVLLPTRQGVWEPNDFAFELDLNRTDSLSRAFELPFTVTRPIRLDGAFRESEQRCRIDFSAPEIRFRNSRLKKTVLTLEQNGETIDLQLHTERFNRKGMPLRLQLTADSRSDTLGVRLDWENESERKFKGRLATRTRFFRDQSDSPLGAAIEIDPTRILVNDTIWEVFPATVFVDSGRISVRDFEVRNESQFIRIEGDASRNRSDELLLSLNDINLDWLFETLNIKNVTFGGQATGDFRISNLGESPVLETQRFKVENFSYNNAVVGKLTLFSRWNNENQGILMRGKIERDPNLETGVDGYIFPTRDSISLHFDTEGLNVAFLRPFLDATLKDISGSVYGKLHFFGNFAALNVVGNAYLKEFSFGIDYLNTYYNFSDSIHLSPTEINFPNLRIYDRENHGARLNGIVRHNHFKDFSYDFTLENARNFQLYNVSELLNPLYFGTVYGNGNAFIRGNEAVTNINVNMQTEGKTVFTFVLSDVNTAGNYQFITYVDRSEEARKKAEHPDGPKSDEEATHLRTGADLNVNLQLDITPQATLQLIMNPATGDQIKANGSGNIRLDYSNYTDLKLYGTYSVDKGSYNFSLQDVISRNFILTPGSSITFRGNPLNADLDIAATYSLTANLSDLDESFAQEKELSRTSVPVKTVLEMSGDLERPELRFNLQFPTLSQDVERRVRTIISSDDMLNRQVIYLLALGKFYTPEYMNLSQTGRSNELASVASSTLSSQLNNILNQISDNWNIGTNFRSEKGDFSDMEFELALSSQLLNNRLIFNGNFGYRENLTTNNAFIGDFDLEYLLNRNGNLRLKAYNHYNDRNYNIKSALTTQGVGIVFKRDFSRFRELFSRFGRKPDEEPKEK